MMIQSLKLLLLAPGRTQLVARLPERDLAGATGRRTKPKQEGVVPLAIRPQEDRLQPVPLLPNTGQLSFVNEAPHSLLPATSGSYHSLAANPILSSSLHTHGGRDHVPTPSYQAQKRHRGITQHQSAVINHRKQQIDYTLDRRIRKVHTRARDKRQNEGAILRAWKRGRLMPTDYDSEEEQIKIRKAKERADKDDDWRMNKGKENLEFLDEMEPWRRPRVHLAGFVRISGESNDVGEEARDSCEDFSTGGEEA